MPLVGGAEAMNMNDNERSLLAENERLRESMAAYDRLLREENERLKASPVGSAATVRRQRDTLLAALREMGKQLEDLAVNEQELQPYFFRLSDIGNIACAAIAEVEENPSANSSRRRNEEGPNT